MESEIEENKVDEGFEEESEEVYFSINNDENSVIRDEIYPRKKSQFS
jgi:hypothetical protein